MPGATSININNRQPLRATGDSRAVRALLIGATLAFLFLFLLFPLVVVFQEAFSKGGAAFLETFHCRPIRRQKTSVWFGLS
jgi:sulfate transport system permease protein